MAAIIMAMRRTTIMADEEVLEDLRQIARHERRSLAAVIRDALERHARRKPRQPGFIGAGEATEPPFDIAERAGELQFEPRSWR